MGNGHEFPTVGTVCMWQSRDTVLGTRCTSERNVHVVPVSPELPPVRPRSLPPAPLRTCFLQSAPFATPALSGVLRRTQSSHPSPWVAHASACVCASPRVSGKSCGFTCIGLVHFSFISEYFVCIFNTVKSFFSYFFF